MSVSISYSFSPTTTIESSQVNQNFTDLVNYLNNTACVTGMVTMWAGAIGSIPTGWQLCNGSGDAPDLRNKFVIGAGNTYSIDDTGGASSITLSHTHSYSHTHETNHTHTYSGITEQAAARSGWPSFDSGSNDRDHVHGYSGTTNGPNDATTDSQSNSTTGAMSANSSKSILPPYYALAYLYKT